MKYDGRRWRVTRNIENIERQNKSIRKGNEVQRG